MQPIIALCSDAKPADGCLFLSNAWLFLAAACCRGGLDMAIMFVFIDVFACNDVFTKIAANIAVIIFNYLFARYVVFHNKRQGEVLQ